MVLKEHNLKKKKNHQILQSILEKLCAFIPNRIIMKGPRAGCSVMDDGHV